MKLDKSIEPIPADSTLLVRPRSSLGLKYVELTPGSGQAGLPAGATIPVRQARPAVVELDDFFNMFDAKTRVGQRRSLDGFGGGLAGRGQDINDGDPRVRAAARRPRAGREEPVGPGHAAEPLLRVARARGRGGGAGGRGAGVAVREPRHGVLGVGVGRAPVPPGDDLGEPAERGARDPGLPAASARSSATARPSSASCGRASRCCRTRAPVLADAFQAGADVLPKTKQMNSDLADVFEKLDEFGQDSGVRAGIDQLTRRRPRCAACSRSSRRRRPPAATGRSSCGTWRACWRRATRTATTSASSPVGAPLDKFTFELGKNNEAGPSAAIANGPQQHNHLHVNMYPNTAAPGPDARVRGGQRALRHRRRRRSGTPPGTQGTKTELQP